MEKFTERNAFLLAAGVGGGTSLLVMLLSGRAEAWDSPLYWQVAYPLVIVFCGWLGYRLPKHPWRFALAAMLIQPLIMIVSASGFGLLPLGLVLFAILSLPAVLAAQLGGWLALRRRDA